MLGVLHVVGVYAQRLVIYLMLKHLGMPVLMTFATWLLVADAANAQLKIDMKENPIFRKQLDNATEAVKTHLVKETKVAGIPVRIDLGNEGGVSIKTAVLNVEKKFPLTGKANLDFDLHFRHVVQKDKEILGIKIPEIVAYDRHEKLVVEYDIKQKTARARVLKGPFKLSQLPQQDYEVWINIDLRDKK
jgi:hypothetical protein